MKQIYFLSLIYMCFVAYGCSPRKTTETAIIGKRIEILFLGHNSEKHNSQKYAPGLANTLFQRGINITYTNNVNDLNGETLSKYDGLILYANYDTITPSQEKALLSFVEGGKGFIAIHSASFCFKNSPAYINLVGGQFKSHKTGTFTAEIVNPNHPVMLGIKPFKTWDETYIHTELEPNNTLLMVRDTSGRKEPWAWVRTQGKGRVFYTAYGHDERTWDNPEFHKLIGNAVLWTVGDEPNKLLVKLNIPPVTYKQAKIPNYENRIPEPELQNPFTPEQSQKLMQVPVGFEIQLFASEPDIKNPVAMAWDERGRLWIIETVDYPNQKEDKDGVGDDLIKICEDTDGDGKADNFTVFADHLNIPTGLAFANGGLIVAQAPNFLFLKDTDGDDKADIREVIMSGWGTFDTHAGPNTLKYGLDNKYWGAVGYSSFEGKVGNKEISFGQGIYRFNADGKDIEYLGRTSNNTWGIGFNENFDVFVSTANNTHSAYYYMPDRFIKRIVEGGQIQGIKKIDGHYGIHTMDLYMRQVDVQGGFTSAVGHNLYTARNFPKEYWNRVGFICEPTGRLVHEAILEPSGAGYIEKDGWNFMASSDEWFAPVAAEVGPDGALWIADWYDFIIQHNPIPDGFEKGKGNAYVTPLRDKADGRIYRIVYKGAKTYMPVKLDKNDPLSLIKGLQNDNMFWRTTAQRLIVENKITSLLPKLYTLVNNKEVDEIGINAPAVHALWTIQGLGALGGNNNEALEVVSNALNHPAYGVRKNAIKILPKNARGLETLLHSGVLNDSNLITRHEAFLALADMPASERAGMILYTLSQDTLNATDPALMQSFFSAVATHKDGFMKASHESTVSGNSLTQRIIKSLENDIRALETWAWIPEENTPDVTEKEITISGTFTTFKQFKGGVFVAHGNSENGYSLYQDTKLHFVVKQNGKAYKISSDVPNSESYDLSARLKKGGTMELQINGQTVATGKARGLFSNRLNNALRVGNDLAGASKVGEYKDNYTSGKALSNAFIEVSANNESTPELAKADITINIKVLKEQMKFDKQSFTVKAGRVVELILDNPDFMQHNWLLCDIGSLSKVGDAADKMVSDPLGAEKSYIPAIPQVLAATKLANPETKQVIRFTVPSKIGDYPYVCTFPGHWRIMNGIMKVVK